MYLAYTVFKRQIKFVSSIHELEAVNIAGSGTGKCATFSIYININIIIFQLVYDVNDFGITHIRAVFLKT